MNKNKVPESTLKIDSGEKQEIKACVRIKEDNPYNIN